MAIMNRLARLFKADLNAVLDHIEEPELQLKQAIREMQDEVTKLAQDIKATHTDIAALKERKNSANELIAKTDDEITICFDNENEELARGLVRRKLETLKLLSTMNESGEKLDKQLESMQACYQEYQTALEGMQQKAELINVSAARPSNGNVANSEGFGVSDQDIEVALLKERERLKGSRSRSSQVSPS